MAFFDFLKKNREPEPLPFSTDIHCHIVPGIDDGSPDASTSADLVEEMQKWGISRILATPHVTQYTFENDAASVEPAFGELKAELGRRGNGIEIGHAAEFRIDELFMERFERDELMLYPNNYILIENSFMQEPWNLEQLIFDLQVRGLHPILAHPERYTYYFGKPGRYEELHRLGVQFQVNVLSLAGHYGKAEKKVAEMLISKDLVDFLGTDLHNASHVDAINAYLSTKDAATHFRALTGRIFNDRAFR